MNRVEISNSPFFTASLDTDFLRQMTSRYFVIFCVFNLLVFLFGQSFTVFDIPDSSEVNLDSVKFWSQPCYLYSWNGVQYGDITVTVNNIKRRIRAVGSFYKFFVNGNNGVSMRYYSKLADNGLQLKLRNPNVGIFLFAMKSVFVIIAGVCLYLSRKNMTFDSNIAINTWSFCFLLFRLLEPLLPVSLENILMCLFWLSFIVLVFYQSKILFSSILWIKAGIVSIIVGTTLSLVIGLVYPFISNFCAFNWLFIPILCWYLFRIGRSVFHSKVLTAHFGFIVVVTGSMFISAISRGYEEATELTMLNETADVSSVILYVVFQMMYVIGDRKMSVNNFSIGTIVQRGKIENLLDILVAREEEELKSGTTFQ